MVILTFYFAAFEFPQAMEVIEPINARLVSAICDFIQHGRTAVSRETLSQIREVLFHVICDFSQIPHRVAAPYSANSKGKLIMCYNKLTCLGSLHIHHTRGLYILVNGKGYYTMST